MGGTLDCALFPWGTTMRARHLRSAFLLALLACAGCARKAVDDGTPLAFVPADTPYVFANVEPVPEATITAWEAQARATLPPMRDLLQQTLATIKRTEPEGVAARMLQGVLDEFESGDPATWWRRAGFDPKAHLAIYGIDLWPVLRVELADPAAFLATVARIEQKTGKSLGSASIGTQDVRTFGDAQAQGLLAIEGRHLVVTIAPADADDAFKRRLLGLDRPAQVFDASALEAFNKARRYVPYGSGWVDTRRAVGLALAHARKADDATCRSEIDALAAKAPRLGFGYRAFDPQHMVMHAQLDLEPALAKSLLAMAQPLPGTADADALVDFAVSLPVLRARDFLRAQTDAIVNAPFKCEALAKLNDDASETKAKLAQTIPPPVRDFTGVRITLDHFAWPAGDDPAAMPDFAGRAVLGTSNPEFLTSLAQVSVPALASITIAKDGKPVAIPAAALPGAAGKLDLQVAMGTNALGVAIGKDEAARLTPAVTTAAAADGTLLVWSMRGAMYATFADAMARFGASLPAEMREQLDAQRRFYAFYAKWLQRVDARVSVSAEGIEFSEAMEFTALP